ncbi:MAG: hypothetical protein HY973_00280, partial [Candidatus Kerfeldbacteria bacterium]|nr:hypothetical protein [Candidatus Kerfeldbacteria bacterium]
DAQHLAVAAINCMDFVLSWNFRHFVNPKVRRMVNAVNILLGYKSLDIFSTEELLGIMEAEESNLK